MSEAALDTRPRDLPDGWPAAAEAELAAVAAADALAGWIIHNGWRLAKLERLDPPGYARARAAIAGRCDVLFPVIHETGEAS